MTRDYKRIKLGNLKAFLRAHEFQNQECECTHDDKKLVTERPTFYKTSGQKTEKATA